MVVAGSGDRERLAVRAEQAHALPGLDPAQRFIGEEHERLAGASLPILRQISAADRFIPTWNPYVAGGVPLFNNAFNYLFNPLMSLPIALLGPVAGSKAAVALALLCAGWAMWALARALGLGAAARISAGVCYLLSGGIAAKFLPGHFQLGISLAWPPLVLAGLWWTLTTRDRRAPALMAVAFALLFWSGNIYYTLHTLIGCALMAAAHLPRLPIRRLLTGAGFALGLSFIQFWPLWITRAFVIHEPVAFDPATGQLTGQYDLIQAAHNYLTPWPAWRQFLAPNAGQGVVPMLPAVDYAYIGPAVPALIAALGLLWALRRAAPGRAGAVAPGRAGAVALALAMLMLIWGAGRRPRSTGCTLICRCWPSSAMWGGRTASARWRGSCWRRWGSMRCGGWHSPHPACCAWGGGRCWSPRCWPPGPI